MLDQVGRSEEAAKLRANGSPRASIPPRHGDEEPVALTIAASLAEERALEIGEMRPVRSPGPQKPGIKVCGASALATDRGDDVPPAQIA